MRGRADVDHGRGEVVGRYLRHGAQGRAGIGERWRIRRGLPFFQRKLLERDGRMLVQMLFGFQLKKG